jgi:hypothetical protein
MDDLKALAAEMRLHDLTSDDLVDGPAIAARLDSFIEQHEKERAFMREGAFIINNAYEGGGPDRPVGGQRWDELAIDWLHRYSALTERAKP